MASVQKRGKDRYRARWREEDGRERSRTFTRFRDARDHAEEMEAQLRRGEYVTPDDRRTTVAEYALRWAAMQPWRPNSQGAYGRLLRNHILPVFGEETLSSVTRSRVQAWATGLQLAPTGQRQALTLLSSIFRAAAHDRLIRVNPCDGVRLARSARGEVSAPTVGEVQALAGAIVPELRAAVLVAAQTGLRQGELFGLTEDRVRWLERSIRVDRQLLTNGGTRFGPTKTARSVRSVPATDETLALLGEQVRVFGLGSNGLVFHNGGAGWRRDTAAARMRAAGGKGWHGLRHHCASILIHQGLSVTAVAAVLGDSPAVVLSTYSHWFPSEDEAIRQAVVRAWSHPGLGRLETGRLD